MEADVGVEPTYPVLQAGALPFCYSAMLLVCAFKMACMRVYLKPGLALPQSGADKKIDQWLQSAAVMS